MKPELWGCLGFLSMVFCFFLATLFSFSIVNNLFSMNVTLHVDTLLLKIFNSSISGQESMKSGPMDIAFLKRLLALFHYSLPWLVVLYRLRG